MKGEEDGPGPCDSTLSRSGLFFRSRFQAGSQDSNAIKGDRSSKAEQSSCCPSLAVHYLPLHLPVLHLLL